MKSVHIVNSYCSNGGVGNYVRRLTKALAQAGQEVVVIHSNADAQSQEGVRLHHVEEYGCYSPKEGAKGPTKLLRVLEEEKPDIVHIHANENYALESQIRKKYAAVKSIHVYEYCPSGSKYHHLTNKVCHHKTGAMCLPRMIYKRCTLDKRPSTLKMFYDRSTDCIRNDQEYEKIIVASRFVREQALQSGYKESSVEVMPYFADEPSSQTQLQDSNVILFCGRVTKEKGVDQVLKALSLLPTNLSWRFAIEGDGPYLDEAKTLAEKLHLGRRVDFLGWRGQRELHQAYADSRVVVVPSVWPEPFGLVGIEAMSYGKPVVGFAVGGIQDWLRDHQSGFLIPPGDLKSMAGCLEQLLQDSGLCEKMGQNAKQVFSQEYTAAKHLDCLMNIYQSVISRKGSGVTS